jgi:peroxiredoxin
VTGHSWSASSEDISDHIASWSWRLYRKSILRLRTLRAQLIAISPELERYTRAVHKKLNLSFDILTDLHLKTAEEYRLVFTFPDSLRELYKSFGSTLDRFHDETEYRLPMPARYVIDQQGIIRAADVNADYTIRPEPSETIGHLRMLAAE